MRVAVVGGGVSGLAAAHELLLAVNGGGDMRVTMYEQEDSLGGRARTVVVDDGASGRVKLDLGFMSFNQDRINFLLCDYRQIPPCEYDAIISCGMIEHVGHEYMDEFFACCESYLAEDGILVLQFISAPEERYEQYRRRTDFIKEYIFPGGCLPSLGRVMSAMTTSSRFCIEHVENIGPHYYTTLMHWRDNFMINKDEILALGFDEKFRRIWEYYLIFSASCFKSRTLGCFLSSRQPSTSRALMAKGNISLSVQLSNHYFLSSCTNKGELIGTCAIGPVPHELRKKKHLKILALAEHIV